MQSKRKFREIFKRDFHEILRKFRLTFKKISPKIEFYIILKKISRNF